MSVCRQCSPNTDVVCAGLFLGKSPLARCTLLTLKVIRSEPRPKCSGLHLDQAAHWIEADDLIEPRHVEQDRIGAKLLAPHRMTSTGYRQWLLCAFRSKHRTL